MSIDIVSFSFEAKNGCKRIEKSMKENRYSKQSLYLLVGTCHGANEKKRVACYGNRAPIHRDLPA